MSDSEKIDRFLQDEEKREERARYALTLLLDRQQQKANHIFALKAQMGTTDSYVTTVPLSWVEQNISFAADLPLFKGNSNLDSKKISVNKNTIDLLQQREPDWRRQLPMSVYLAERENHKFPPLLVVSYQDWTYQEPHESDSWGMDKRAIKHSIPVTSLDSNGSILDIDNKNTFYYALDGQHRLMAIKGLKQLLSNRQLNALDKDRKPKMKSFVMLDDVIQSIIKNRINQGRSDLSETKIGEMLQLRMNETIGIEIIPAVQKNETQEDAVSRLRQVFVDVNEQAKSPSKGDNIMLDNNNGYRIVARNVMVQHKLLNEDKTILKQSQLAENSEYYTTLKELANIAEKYLGKTEFKHWKDPAVGHASYGYMRPSEDELRSGESLLTEYFDALESLPSHQWFMQADKEDRGEIRGEKKGNNSSSAPNPMIVDNILFRPLAQSAFADAVGMILAGSETPRDQFKGKLNSIIQYLSQQEEKGMLRLRDTTSPWFGILCDPTGKNMRRDKKSQELCKRMFVYLLHGMNDVEREKLKKDFVKARAVTDETGWSLNDSNQPVSLNKIKLPNSWHS